LGRRPSHHLPAVQGFPALGRQVSNADSNSYQHNNTNANADEYPHTNLYPHRHANAIANSYAHGPTDPHLYADRNTHGHADGDIYGDPNCYAHHSSTRPEHIEQDG
jgi:hypothetical protein